MINDLPIIVGIATQEARKASLPDTLESLDGQVDMVCVYHNDYLRTEAYDVSYDVRYCSGIGLYGGVTAYGDIGDIAKFWPAIWEEDEDEFYCFVCDDDLIYPEDYAETVVAAIDRHDRNALVGFHGREYYRPVESYYRDLGPAVDSGLADIYRALDDVFYEGECTIISTCAAGWHSSLFSLSMDDFKWNGEVVPNMSDIFLNRKLNDLGIPRIVIPHEAGWIRHTDKIDMSGEICSRHWDDDAIQTEVFNATRWKL